jgi:hypothetical protein
VFNQNGSGFLHGQSQQVYNRLSWVGTLSLLSQRQACMVLLLCMLSLSGPVV